MRRLLSNSLLTATLTATMILSGAVVLTLPASAEQRRITVRLADGSLVTVTVDVPPGTPLEQLELPGVPVGAGDPAEPAPETEAAPSPQGAPAAPSVAAGDEAAPTPDPEVVPTKPQVRRGGAQRGGGDRRVARRPARRGPRSKPRVRIEPRRPGRRAPQRPVRRPDGRPTPSNPTFFDALPGPGTGTTAVPNFVIRKFRVPPFLLPIYQAAGIQYGVRWEILAAVNEIETDYGRNLNVSTAGALGWMQFMPATWRAYGVDGNHDGQRDPYNPVDAIFAAARYLKASGAQEDIRGAIFAYNHADWYVDSVLMRARLIAGVPEDVVGSLTGLTEGRFPVYARAQYADDLAEGAATRRVPAGRNAANVVEDDETRRGIRIFSRRGAPVVAVNDGVVKEIGRNKQLGRYLVLQDVYGNRYTYSGLASISKLYPAPRDQVRLDGAPKAEATPARDPRPRLPASAGRQSGGRGSDRSAAGGSDRPARRRSAGGQPAGPSGSLPGFSAGASVPAPGASSPPSGARSAPRPRLGHKTRLFANPRRPRAQRAGGLAQLLAAGVAGDLASLRKLESWERFRNYFSRPVAFDPSTMRLAPMRPGVRVIGGTIIGRVGRPLARQAPHVYFEIRPAGRGAPYIDPKPILDGWKLLESTAVYRAGGRNALYGADGFSIGQIMLLPKPLLQKRVLSDDRIDVYECGRNDIRTGQVDRRVLATLAYLAEAGLEPTVTSLKCGHSFLTASGSVSHHSSGNAVDIAAVNGVPILGHQERGGVTEQTVKQLMRLQGTMAADQIISLLDLGGATLSMGDHADHIHVGFRPLFGDNRKLGQQAQAVLQPGQWHDLLARLREIDNPAVPRKTSRFAIPEPRKAGSRAHRGE